jgi:hypothetical protein
MTDRSTRRAATLMAVALISACDSTSPGTDSRMLQVRGQVLEAGQGPSPALDIRIQAWPALGAEGQDTATRQTDAAGLYAAELGSFPGTRVDSVRVRVTQYDCVATLPTDLWQRDVGLGDGGALALPTVDLPHRLQGAALGPGAEMCASISNPEHYEHAHLALRVDDVTDSVRGRWLLDHSTSIPTNLGYFSGSYALDPVKHLTLVLRPKQPTDCTGLRIEVPMGGELGNEFGPATLIGDGSCQVPSGTIRFFRGLGGINLLLPPLPPPGGG